MISTLRDRRIYLVFVICCALASITRSQGFKGIVPLVSTCDDVKKILKVEECKLPQSVYFLKDYWVRINFITDRHASGDNWCYKVPPGTVSSIGVSYNKPFPIEEFQYELSFLEGPSGDIGTTTYENVAKGIRVLANNGRINTADFFPTPEQRKKLGYRCDAETSNDECSANY